MREVDHETLAAVALQRVVHVLECVGNHFLRLLVVAGAGGEGVVKRVAVGDFHHLVERIYVSAENPATTGSESGKHLLHLVYDREREESPPFSVAFSCDLVS